MTIRELQHALAVGPATSDLDNDALTDEELLISVCLGIVAIEPESGRVGLIHYTAREYFNEHPIKDPLHARTEIAKTCLTYLGFNEFASGPGSNHKELNARLENYPLLWYAARWWGVHMHGISDPEVLTQALTFLMDDSRMSAAGELMYTFDDGRARFYPRIFTGLHIAARFGLQQLVKFMMENTKVRINGQDDYGQTALSIAARWKHMALLEYMLGLLTIDIDAGNSSHCGTALHAAVRGGHMACIERLLRARANIAATASKGSTPLHLAADNGDVNVIK